MKYQFDVTCPRCGADPDHLTTSAVSPVLTLTTKAICECRQCRCEWVLELTLAPADRATFMVVKNQGIRPACGTEGGYKAHTRRSEAACQPCRDAHRIYQRSTPSGKLSHRARPKVDA
jgi:hypothetical protein